MRKVIRKNFWAWQADDEEKWINDMSAQGWQLVAVGWFRYEFEKGEPNEYCYRLEMLEHWPTHHKSVEYIQFVEDTGAECFSTIKNWAYFRKRSSEGSFELFSDVKGKLALNKRYLQLLGVLFFIELIYLPPAIFLVIDEMVLSLLTVVGFNFVIFVMIGLGLLKIIRQRNELKREQSIVE